MSAPDTFPIEGTCPICEARGTILASYGDGVTGPVFVDSYAHLAEWRASQPVAPRPAYLANYAGD